MNIRERAGLVPARILRPRWLYPTIAAALVGAFLLQALLSMRELSPTFDEPLYIAAGYSYWKTRDDRMNYEHPPLVKLLVAMPLLPLGLTVPTDDPSWRDPNQYAFGAAFLDRAPGVGEQIVFRSRLLIVFIGVLLAVFVRKWAADLWGPEAGLAALFMFAFEPNILAQSRLATLDLGFAACTFISMYYLWKWQGTGRPGDAVLASLTLGCALLSKHTALVFLPIWLAGFVLSHVAASRSRVPWRLTLVKGFLQLLTGGVIVVIVVYAAAFRWHPLLRLHGEHRTVAKVLAPIPFLRGRVETRIVALGQHFRVPAVDQYVKGILWQRKHVLEGRMSFLMGRHSQHGWWYYYPVVFLIRTSLPILLLVMLRLFLLRAVPMVTGEYVVVLPIIGIMVLACFDNLDFGVRYLLPLYPLLFVWLSRVVALALFGTRVLTARPATPQIPVKALSGRH